jgi:hypothetical protein
MQNETLRFWLAWILVTIAGITLGVIIVIPAAVQFAYSGEWPFLIGLMTGAVLGATTGTCQWLLLRRRTPVTYRWIIGSVVGGMIGMALGMALEPTAEPATNARDATREAMALVIPWRVAWQTGVAGALFGVGIGIGQWYVLRQYARSAYWWIFANGLAWMAGLGIGALLAPIFTTLGALLVTGLIAAIITGQVMERWQWEMRKRTEPIPGRRF